MKKTKKNSRIKQYKCHCGHEFEREVVYIPNELSTPVRCPKCINLIPTWKKESTGNIVGRKHIHIRR